MSHKEIRHAILVRARFCHRSVHVDRSAQTPASSGNDWTSVGTSFASDGQRRRRSFNAMISAAGPIRVFASHDSVEPAKVLESTSGAAVARRAPYIYPPP